MSEAHVSHANITRVLEAAYAQGRLHELITFVGDPDEGVRLARWLGETIAPRPVRVLVRPEVNDDWLSVFDTTERGTVTVLCTAHPEMVPPEVMQRSTRFLLQGGMA